MILVFPFLIGAASEKVQFTCQYLLINSNNNVQIDLVVMYLNRYEMRKENLQISSKIEKSIL